jgi:signal transduction histidine kinase
MADRVRPRWRDVPAVLWSRRTWRAVAHLVTGALLWTVPAGLALVLVGLAGKKGPLPGVRIGGSEKPARMLATLVVLLLTLVLLLALTTRFTAWQRARFRAILGEELAPFAPRDRDGRRWRWLARAAVDRQTWRQVRYHLLGGALNAVAAGAVIAGVVLGVALVAVAAVRQRPATGGRFAVAAAIGVALVLAAPWLARGAAALDLVLARALLQPSTSDTLARRVESLSASRAGAIDAADAERRRIERNLHDGTQQRLVSLAMNLGMTRAAVRDARPEIRQAVADAHEEAKQALAELRDFIRGLHPAVLDELGLDAALSGTAARSPVPVRLTVELGERPPAAVEAVAYFVVSEALTNVARHAAATRADVVVGPRPGGLFLSVTDNGRGGADPARGTGLRGLQQRVESLDGTLRIASPAGGPTSILVALPCAS